jgi:hypothetical protein
MQSREGMHSAGEMILKIKIKKLCEEAIYYLVL